MPNHIGLYVRAMGLSKKERRQFILNELLLLLIISALLFTAVIIFATPHLSSFESVVGVVLTGALLVFMVILYIRTRKWAKEQEKLDNQENQTKD